MALIYHPAPDEGPPRRAVRRARWGGGGWRRPTFAGAGILSVVALVGLVVLPEINFVGDSWIPITAGVLLAALVVLGAGASRLRAKRRSAVPRCKLCGERLDAGLEKPEAAPSGPRCPECGAPGTST